MNTLGRRHLIMSSLAVGAAAVAGGKLLAGCSRGLSCDDTSGLSAADLTMRNANTYVEQTPDVSKRCDNCNFFQSRGANACGGCQLIKGPINPAGYCRLWAAKAAS